MVEAQLVERLLPTPEDPGSNPAINKIYWAFICCELFTKNEKKASVGPFKTNFESRKFYSVCLEPWSQGACLCRIVWFNLVKLISVYLGA